MKRFWSEVAIERGAILLDGRPVKTPARAPLLLPTAALADAIATEWRNVVERVDPRTMPMTGLANAAIDHVAPDPSAFAATMSAYSETDLLCYRAEAPTDLVERQAQAWDPLLDWARRRYDVAFSVTSGIVHVAQPPATVTRLTTAVAAHDAFALVALSQLVTIAGSLVIALALAEDVLTPAEGFAAAHLDELWQADHWGEEWSSAEARAARLADFEAAARFLKLAS